MVSARQIEIARSEALAMQIDGDRFDAPSVRFEIGRDLVPILVPKSI
jgi:diacylglycerol kinase family enzyme